MNTNQVYKAIQSTKLERHWITPEYENAVRDFVNYNKTRCGFDPIELDQARHNCKESPPMAIQSGLYSVIRELLPLMLRMRECLDTTPDGNETAKLFDNLFYKSKWKG